MPANFSVVAENEMTYVVGGGLLEAIGSVTAPVWTPANVKTFNTNLVTIVGNQYVGKLLKGTLGVMFGGNWGGDDGDKIFGDDGALKKNIYGDVNGDDMTFGNKVMRTLGMASVVYTLGTAPAKIGFNDGVMGIASQGADGKWNLGV